jgi:CBS domain containing-hemolysin-like protein
MRAMLREPLRVPETKPIGELLRDFQRSEVHMAVVVDEYGGTSGLCTIEDVIEEIVGEIHDEHEPEHELPPEMVAVGERRYEADGRVTIAEINERLELALPEDGDFDTVAGFLLDRFGRVPVAGERDEIPEAIFEVIAASATRIERVAIEVRSGRMPASDASLEELEAMRDGKLDLDVERESSHDPQSEARQEARQEVRQEPRHE